MSNHSENVQLVMNQIKKMQLQKQAIQKDKENTLMKINNDLIKVKNLPQIPVTVLETIKIDVPFDKLNLADISYLIAYLNHSKTQYEKSYDQLTEHSKNAIVDLEQELKNNNLDVYYNVAKIMIDFGF